MPGADDFLIEGYVACRCGTWLVKGASERCEDCRRADSGRADALAVQIGAEVVRLGPRKRRRRAVKAPRRSESGVQARRMRDRAEKRAMRMLAKAHPGDYAALLERELERERAESMTEGADSA